MPRVYPHADLRESLDEHRRADADTHGGDDADGTGGGMARVEQQVLAGNETVTILTTQ